MAVSSYGLRRFNDEDEAMNLVPSVEVVVKMTPAEAHSYASHKRERDTLGRVTLAEQNRELGDPIMNLLVEHGYGEDP